MGEPTTTLDPEKYQDKEQFIQDYISTIPGGTRTQAETAWIAAHSDEPEIWSRGEAADQFVFNQYKGPLTALDNVSSPLATQFLNWHGSRWLEAQGRFPNSWELFEDNEYTNAVEWLPYASLGLPPAFVWNDHPVTYSPFVGIKPIPFASHIPVDDDRTPLADELAGLPFDDRGVEMERNPNANLGLPVITAEALANATKRPSSGSGRSPAAFDKDQLTDSASDLWRASLLAPPPADIRGMVDEYAKEANSFWLSKGGRLDFDTFMLNKIRGTSRYKELYRHKPDEVLESQYIGQFVSAAGQVGLSAGATGEVAARAASAGATPIGTTQLAADTTSFQRSGSFSRQLANTISQMGAGATAA